MLYDNSVDIFKVCRMEEIRILSFSASFVVGGMCVVSLALAVLLMIGLIIQP